MQSSYLDKLNDRPRQAVEFGAGAGLPPPLLVIAGAGSGKTNTLTHRVAHLLVAGADPRRILLMTFSRRAATELTRRVERITTAALGQGYAAEALTWAGTFHGIGARTRRLRYQIVPRKMKVMGATMAGGTASIKRPPNCKWVALWVARLDDNTEGKRQFSVGPLI